MFALVYSLVIKYFAIITFVAQRRPLATYVLHICDLFSVSLATVHAGELSHGQILHTLDPTGLTQVVRSTLFSYCFAITE